MGHAPKDYRVIYQHYALSSTATDAVNAFVEKRHNSRSWCWVSRERGIFRLTPVRQDREFVFIVAPYENVVTKVASWLVVKITAVREKLTPC